MGSARQKKSIKWVTVTFKGQRISVNYGTEAERILGSKDKEQVRLGKKVIFLNGLQVVPSALIEEDCTMELRKP